jgi:LuxR family transcriptional regulator, maltose regulon positive regulatory protein
VDEFELRLAGMAHNEPDWALRNGRVAIQLYQGDFLPELLYESWSVDERERLLARYLIAAIDLATRQLVAGDPLAAIETSELVLRRDRCYEEAYQILIQAYDMLGKRSQALHAFERCTQALQEEIGIEPLPETIDLINLVRANRRVHPG